jgi:hypothetical protein
MLPPTYARILSLEKNKFVGGDKIQSQNGLADAPQPLQLIAQFARDAAIPNQVPI